MGYSVVAITLPEEDLVELRWRTNESENIKRWLDLAEVHKSLYSNTIVLFWRDVEWYDYSEEVLYIMGFLREIRGYIFQRIGYYDYSDIEVEYGGDWTCLEEGAVIHRSIQVGIPRAGWESINLDRVDRLEPVEISEQDFMNII